ncbi:Phospho-2-dehydro-3-deoxyheptonate aldolase AroG [Mactra antiquata]
MKIMASDDNKPKKVLVAFDFDHTIIDGNSDIHITTLGPNGHIPQEIKDKYSDNGWTHYMAAIFKYLHGHNIKSQDLKSSIEELPLVEGMDELFQYLNDETFEVIIISDSNSVFIDYALEKYGLKTIVKRVYTNPAKYDNDDLLGIEFYHTQDWCDLSTENLCKGHILEEHIEERKKEVEFSHILYVGDGTNDLCPSLRLSDRDFVFPRQDFSLWKKLKKLGCLDDATSDLDLKAKVIVWKSGLEVLDICKRLKRGDIV